MATETELSEALSQYGFSVLLLLIRLIRRTAEVDDCSYGKQCFANMIQTLGHRNRQQIVWDFLPSIDSAQLLQTCLDSDLLR